MKCTQGLLVLLPLLLVAPTAAQMPDAPGTLPEVVEMGEGETTLLLLPCMSCRWRSFDGFMERNQDRYRMIAVTAPGYGGTPVPEIAMDTADPLWNANAVAAVVQMVEDRELEQVIIVGHSWGGILGTQVAARLGERVAGMVFIDAWPTSDRSWFREERGEQVAQAFSVTAAQAHLRHDLDAWQAFNSVSALMEPERRMAYHGWFMATPPAVVIQYWRENSLVDLNPLLAAIPARILDLKALPGSADPEEYRAERCDSWTRNCPDCRVRTVLVPESGHFVHETRPQVVDEEIRSFVEEIRRGDD